MHRARTLLAVTGPSSLRGDDDTNDPLDVAGLPRLGTHAFQPLDPDYLRMRMTAAALAGAFMGLAAIVATLLSASWMVAATGAGGLALLGVVTLVRRFEIRHMGFLVRQQDVSFKSGLISRSVASVPFGRVQHVAIHRGPLDRRFGLATLQMRTAGGQISIPGLRVELAEDLKQLVADRASELADAEIDGDGRV